MSQPHGVLIVKQLLMPMKMKFRRALYAFNKDAREQYSNMTEWKEKSEDNIGRELNLILFMHLNWQRNLV